MRQIVGYFQNLHKNRKQYFLSLSSDSSQNLFRGTRNSFIESRLHAVVNDHQGNDYDFIDELLQKRTTVQLEKVCSECEAENEHYMRKCTNGKDSLEKENSEFYAQTQKQYPYKHYQDVAVNKNEFKVKTGEPDRVNPSSFDNISHILFNIAEKAGINSNEEARKWLFLECDGGIYYLVEKLIFNVFIVMHVEAPSLTKMPFLITSVVFCMIFLQHMNLGGCYHCLA